MFSTARAETSTNIERCQRTSAAPFPAARSCTETRIGRAARTVTASRLNDAAPPGIACDSATKGGGVA